MSESRRYPPRGSRKCHFMLPPRWCINTRTPKFVPAHREKDGSYPHHAAGNNAHTYCVDFLAHGIRRETNPLHADEQQAKRGIRSIRVNTRVEGDIQGPGRSTSVSQAVDEHG